MRVRNSKLVIILALWVATWSMHAVAQQPSIQEQKQALELRKSQIQEEIEVANTILSQTRASRNTTLSEVRALDNKLRARRRADGTNTWTQEVAGSLLSQPVYLDGLIIVSPLNANYLIAAYDEDGNLQWTYQAPGTGDKPRTWLCTSCHGRSQAIRVSSFAILCA